MKCQYDSKEYPGMKEGVFHDKHYTAVFIIQSPIFYRPVPPNTKISESAKLFLPLLVTM